MCVHSHHNIGRIRIHHCSINLLVWDLGGQTSIRPYWRCYYSNTDAIIYVVDSADRDRLAISKSELVSMLEVSHCICNCGCVAVVVIVVVYLHYFACLSKIVQWI